MFRLLAILCAGLFLTLLIGGRDAGQTRFGLQGAYQIAALNDAPEPKGAQIAAPAPVKTTEPAPKPARDTASRVTQASFASTDATGRDGTPQPGLTLSLPLMASPAPLVPAPAPIRAAAEPAPQRISRILGSRVNVREAPSAKSAVLDRLARDETVTVISSDGSGWSLVRIEGDGIEGYVASRYLSDDAGESGLFPAE